MKEQTNMFGHLLNSCLDAPSFAQRLMEFTGITDLTEISELIRYGLEQDLLRISLVGSGEAGRLYVHNRSVRLTNMKTLPRLVRKDDEYRRRSINPIGQLLGVDLSETYVSAVNSLNLVRYSPNPHVLRLLDCCLARGIISNKASADQMTLLMMSEFRRFGTGNYLLPMFPDRRYRIYTDSSGIASYQGGDAHRAVCDFAEARTVSDEDIHYALQGLTAEYGVGEDNYLSILRAGPEFIANFGDFGASSKPWCSFRAAVAVDEMLRDQRTAYVYQQDQTCSGAALYAWLTGDRQLGLLTNFLPSTEKQDFYGYAAELVRKFKLLPTQARDLSIFGERSTAKTFIIPMIYGAAPVSLTRGLILDDPQKDGVQFVDQLGQYIPGSLETLEPSRFNSNYFEFLKGLTWRVAVDVGSDVAQAYIRAVFGNDEMRGCTTRLRPAMSKLKECAKAANAAGRELSWTSPSGCHVVNHKLVVDHEADPVAINVNHGDVRHRISFQPVMAVNSEAAAPPNVIHSVDGSVVHFTANTCAAEGIALAPIHDSFGTHVAHARRVKSIVRDAICNVPQDLIDQICVSQNVEPLGYEGLPVSEFRKAEHFLG